jgi:hypothetical protein
MTINRPREAGIEILKHSIAGLYKTDICGDVTT